MLLLRPDVIEDFHQRIDSLKSEAREEERRRAGLTIALAGASL